MYFFLLNTVLFTDLVVVAIFQISVKFYVSNFQDIDINLIIQLSNGFFYRFFVIDFRKQNVKFFLIFSVNNSNIFKISKVETANKTKNVIFGFKPQKKV